MGEGIEFRRKLMIDNLDVLTREVFEIHPPVKSSTSVLTASTVCQSCGCRTNTKSSLGTRQAGCFCECHKEESPKIEGRAFLFKGASTQVTDNRTNQDL